MAILGVKHCRQQENQRARDHAEPQISHLSHRSPVRVSAARRIVLPVRRATLSPRLTKS
jgi:hypothetical protein